MKLGVTYHIAISVDIDRFHDGKLVEYLSSFAPLGCTTVDDVRKKCAEARALGQVVFAPCGNTAEDGHCLGHEESSGVHAISRFG